MHTCTHTHMHTRTHTHTHTHTHTCSSGPGGVPAQMPSMETTAATAQMLINNPMMQQYGQVMATRGQAMLDSSVSNTGEGVCDSIAGRGVAVWVGGMWQYGLEGVWEGSQVQ